jgi:uncharacterized protein (DUF1330 family)
MSVLILVQGNLNPDKTDILQQYQQTARATIGKHSGQPVARGGGLGSLHGSRKWQAGMVIRFPDEASARGWYNDPEYQKVLPLRDQAYAELEITMFQE